MEPLEPSAAERSLASAERSRARLAKLRTIGIHVGVALAATAILAALVLVHVKPQFSLVPPHVATALAAVLFVVLAGGVRYLFSLTGRK